MYGLCQARVVHPGNRLGRIFGVVRFHRAVATLLASSPNATSPARVRATLLNRSRGCAALLLRLPSVAHSFATRAAFAASTTSWPLRPSPCVNDASINVVAPSSGSAPRICPQRAGEAAHVQAFRLTVRGRSDGMPITMP
jgi:hypothetical protein